MPTNSVISQEKIFDILKTIKFPNLSRDIVSFGLIKGVEIEDGLVRIKVRVAARDKNIPVAIEHDISRALRDLPGVREVQVEMSWVQPEGAAATPRAPHSSPPSDQPLLPGVKTKIA